MEKSHDFLLGTTDAQVSGWLQSLAPGDADLDRRFNQEEDFFVVLHRPFIVEPFDIHHDVAENQAPERYLRVIRSPVDAWTDQISGARRPFPSSRSGAGTTRFRSGA